MAVIGAGSQVYLERLEPAAHALQQAGALALGPFADARPPGEMGQRLAQLGYAPHLYLQVQGMTLPATFWDAMAQVGAKAIYIATPNCYHGPYTLQALERGFHVLLEKPMASSVEQAQAIVSMAAHQPSTYPQRTPVQAMCTLHYLHYGISLALLRLAQSGQLEERLGKCVRVTGALLETDDLRHSRHRWLFDPEQSGGDILIDTGGHPLSILYGVGAQTIMVTAARWDTLLEQAPAVAIGGQQRQPATYFELDLALSGGIFAPGATGCIAVGKGIPPRLAGKFLVLTCERGSVELTFPDGLVLRDAQHRPFDDALPADHATPPYTTILRRFVGSLQAEGNPGSTLEIALACLQTIFEAYAICSRTPFYHQVWAIQRVAAF
jgi:predicted dehydrogenase